MNKNGFDDALMATESLQSNSKAWHRPLRRVGGAILAASSAIGTDIRSHVGLSETRIKIAHLSVLASWNGCCVSLIAS
jgi:hypothetical protein